MEEYTIEKEIWKDIKEYEGIYQVSNLGTVSYTHLTLPTKLEV